MPVKINADLLFLKELIDNTIRLKSLDILVITDNNIVKIAFRL